MMKEIAALLLLSFSINSALAQGVKIGNNSGDPHPSAVFEVESSSAGFLPPRLTSAQRDAIVNPAEGLRIYNLDTRCENYYNGIVWRELCGTCLPQPLSNAGPDQAISGGNSTTLAAMGNGPGQWSVLSGSGGSYSEASDPNTLFTGNFGETYQLVWSVTTSCGTTSDTVQISIPCNGQWAYRRQVTVTNPNAFELTNYQVSVTINHQALVNSGKSMATGADIRFTDASCNALFHYADPFTINTPGSIFWVKVPSIPASASIQLTLYYGNSTAVSTSSGDDTFILFDDFNSNLNKWDIRATPTIENGGKVRIATNCNNYVGDQIINKTAMPYGSIIETRTANPLNATDGVRGSFCGASSISGNSQYFLSDFGTNSHYATWNLGRGGLIQFLGITANGPSVGYGPNIGTSFSANEWFGVAIESDRVAYFRNGTQLGSTTSNLPTATLYPVLNAIVDFSSPRCQEFQIDEFRVRKFTQNPPTTSVDPEQEN